jgi:excisionase family DNA binding protein
MTASFVTEADNITMHELCVLLRSNQSTITSWIKSGKIPAPIRIGRTRLWPRAEFMAWLEGQREGVVCAD